MVFALALFGSASCTLLVSTTGLTGNVAKDAAASDAPNAGDARDALAAGDGGADAPADGGPFCASHGGATFCADFDQGDAQAGWTTSGSGGAGGSLSLDTTAYVSAPASLVAIASAGQSSGFGLGVRLEKKMTMPVAPRSAHLSYDLRLDGADSTKSPQLVTIGFGPDANRRYFVTLATNGSNAFIQEDVPPLDGGQTRFPQRPLSRPIVLGSWTHVDMTVDFDSRTIVMTLDGNQGFSAAMDPEGMSGPSIEFDIGAIYYSSGSVASASAHYDNVLLDLK